MKLSLHSPDHKAEVNVARLVAVTNRYSKNTDSSLLINLAVCLRKLGKSVCVFETDNYSKNQVFLTHQVNNSSTLDLINGNILIHELMEEGPEGIDVIPQSNGIGEYASLESGQKQNLLLAFTQLQHEYDFVLIDTAAGIDLSTVGFLLGAGAIVITITPDAKSLTSAFSLLKEIKQRVFHEPVKVIVNLVSGENEAKRIIARLSVAVRNYLGKQCGGMSFFIFDMPMLEIMSSQPLVSVEYPNSAPSQCLKNIVLRLTEAGHPESLTLSNQLSDLQTPCKVDYELTPESSLNLENDWVSYALKSLMSEPAEVIDPVMKRLNEVWCERRLLLTNNTEENTISVEELDLLNLKAAMHFASKVDD